MRQGWKSLPLGLAFAIVALAVLPLVAPRIGDAAAAGKSSAGETKAKNGQRQFTGIVTALDKNTVTVEKRGKKPESRSFSRHAEIRIEGDLVKDARVTVYYREQGGQAIAHRVIVKPQNGTAKGSR
ncbi:MAG: hypothetical protein ACRENJ_07215 [Candidatus Eiseniibacteriota bacterium]